MLDAANSLIPGLLLAWLTPTHWIIIAIVILVLFGGKKLPELARGLARGLRIFKDELHGVKKELDSADDVTPDQADSQNEPAPTDPKDKPDQTKLG